MILWVSNLGGHSRAILLLRVVLSRIIQWNSGSGQVCLEGPRWLHSHVCAWAGMSGRLGSAGPSLFPGGLRAFPQSFSSRPWEDTAAYHFHSLLALAWCTQIPRDGETDSGGRARSHFKRACGMGDTVIGIFGK